MNNLENLLECPICNSKLLSYGNTLTGPRKKCPNTVAAYLSHFNTSDNKYCNLYITHNYKYYYVYINEFKSFIYEYYLSSKDGTSQYSKLIAAINILSPKDIVS